MAWDVLSRDVLSYIRFLHIIESLRKQIVTGQNAHKLGEQCDLTIDPFALDKTHIQLYTVKISVTLHHYWWQLNGHWFWFNLSTAIKATFCSILMILRITTAITGRNVLKFTTGEMLASNCFSRKVSAS